METNIVLAVLMGLPGSGKTTLCNALIDSHRLKEESEGRCNGGSIVFVHVCFDELIPLSVQRDFVEQRKSEEVSVQKKSDEESWRDCVDQKKKSEEESSRDFVEQKKSEERSRRDCVKVGSPAEERSEKNGVVVGSADGSRRESMSIGNNEEGSKGDGNRGKNNEGSGNSSVKIANEERSTTTDTMRAENEAGSGRDYVRIESGIGEGCRGVESKEGENNDSDDCRSEKQGTMSSALDWKTARHKILSQVNKLLQYINGPRATKCKKESKSSTVDKDINANTSAKTKEEDDGNRSSESDVEDFIYGVSRDIIDKGKKFVILLDDNFYYRSMRYEYYQLARRHSAAFCQVYVSCSVEEATQNNSMREKENRVPTEVVIAMGERLEPPQPYVNTWEGNTCVVKGSNIAEVWRKMVQSFHCGLSPVYDRTEEIQVARKRCSQNVIHQADLSLRILVKSLIKEEMKESVHGQTKLQASEVARRVNAARQAVLGDLKDGRIEAPIHLSETVTKENKEELDTFLEVEMKREILKRM